MLERKKSMNRCRRRLCVLIGVLLLAALAFLPVRFSTVTVGRDPLTNAVWRKTASSPGYLFAPLFIRHRDDPLPDEQSYAVRYALRRSLEVRATQIRLNTGWLILELGLLGLVGALDYAVLCRRRFRPPGRPPAAGPPASLV